MRYPTVCLSAYCGNVICAGCRHRPQLVEWHRQQGTEQQYEAKQAELLRERDCLRDDG